ncbi:MAG TPA: hypothetical protein VN281_17185 [Verrucomicrobiae bacterium]|nr:hypothetical protein [Verrucomicrobiae bacterium]
MKAIASTTFGEISVRTLDWTFVSTIDFDPRCTCQTSVAIRAESRGGQPPMLFRRFPSPKTIEKAREITIANIFAQSLYLNVEMRFNWKWFRLAIVPAIILLITGCGGFSGSHSVSPASFFLPGILKAEPNPPQSQAHPVLTVPKLEPAKQVALAQ